MIFDYKIELSLNLAYGNVVAFALRSAVAEDRVVFMRSTLRACETDYTSDVTTVREDVAFYGTSDIASFTDRNSAILRFRRFAIAPNFFSLSLFSSITPSTCAAVNENTLNELESKAAM